MTTLPQTSTVRVPRTVAPGQITIPGVSAAGGPNGMVPHAAPVGPGGGPMLTGGDVWRVLRTNWWLLGLMLVVGIVGGYFLNRYLARNHARYTATGLIRVETMLEMNPTGFGTTAPREAVELEQQSQTNLLLHPTLLVGVLEDPNSEIRRTGWFQQYKTGNGYDIEKAKQNLLDIYGVSPVNNSRLIRAEVTWKNPEDSRVILKEVVDRHIQQQKESVQRDLGARSKTLNTQRQQYREAYDRLKILRSNMASVVGTDGTVSNSNSIKQWDLSHTLRDLARYQEEYNDAESEYRNLAAAINSGSTPPAAEEIARRHPIYIDYRARVDALNVQLKSVVTQSDQHNQFQATQKQLDEYEKLLENWEVELESKATQQLLSEAESKLAQAKANRDRAEAAAEQLRRELGELSKQVSDYERLRTEEEDYRERLRNVEDDLDEIDKQRLPLDWGPAEWAKLPLKPETPSFPKLPVTLGLSAVLCLALGLGIAFVRELTDTTVRSPRDIQRVGQMALLGMVPHEADDPQAAGARFPLVIFDAPYSMAAEEFRKLRTRLQHMASLDTTRSILVTGAGAGDGKTTVACNLAAGLALNGRRILLVDANFRRPELHKVFGLDNAQGFGDVLNVPESMESVVRDTPIPNLSVVTTGAKPANVTELLESQLLIDFIERALDEYDHVVFDSGALLMASETLALAPRVDGVVTVARARSNTRGVLQRMRDTLRQVKAEHLGVVLNAVRSQAGGYYGRSITDYYKYSNGSMNGHAN